MRFDLPEYASGHCRIDICSNQNPNVAILWFGGNFALPTSNLCGQSISNDSHTTPVQNFSRIL